MDNPKSKTLFHFTKDREAFYSILENGLKFVYNEERYNDVFHYALPMICFCDMPLTMISDHTKRYGAFGIGFDKSKMIRYWHLLNPVNYIFSKNLLDGAEMFLNIVQKDYDDNDAESKKRYQCATSLLAFMKPYHDTRKNRVLYNESEWRLIVPDKTNIEGFEPIEWFWDENKYVEFKRNNRIMDTHLPIFEFSPEEVRFILVEDSRDRYVIADKLMNMETFGGRKIQQYQKYELLTKVVFLDEIKENY